MPAGDYRYVSGFTWEAGAQLASTLSGVVARGFISDEALGPRAHIVKVVGEVDLASSREVENALRDLILAGKTTVVVDISIATDLTPGLLGVLIRAQRSVSWRNGRLVLVCENVAFLERLSSTGLTDVFDLLAPEDLPRLVQRGAPKEADSAA